MFDLKAQLATLDENNHPGLLSVTDLRHPTSVRSAPSAPTWRRCGSSARGGFIPKGGMLPPDSPTAHPPCSNEARVAGAWSCSRRTSTADGMTSGPALVRALCGRGSEVCLGCAAGSGYLVGATPEGVPETPGVFRTAGNRLVAVNVDPRETEPSRLPPHIDRARGTPERCSR